MNRKREQATIFTQLGELFGPLMSMAENPASYDSDERTRIHARYCFDVELFRNKVTQYGQGEPGHYYQIQWQRVHRTLTIHSLLDHSINPESYCAAAKTTYRESFDALYSIPVPIESSIHEAHSPFSTYCLIKDLCLTAANTVVWIDRYFDSSIFHRYFVETPLPTLITLVTWPKTRCNGSKDIKRYEDFMDISKLFAQERGTTGYRLAQPIHQQFPLTRKTA